MGIITYIALSASFKALLDTGNIIQAKEKHIILIGGITMTFNNVKRGDGRFNFHNDQENTCQKHNIYKLIFDNAKDIILYISKEGQILDANKMAMKKYGYTYDELLSMNMADLRHPSMDNFSIHPQLSLYTNSHNGMIFEAVQVKKDGSSFPVEISSNTIEVNGDIFKVCIIRDIENRKIINEKILYLATYDFLTNIANRGSIISQLDYAIDKSRITSKDLAFIVFDIDKFKFINDTFGHPVGDKVLYYVAQTVKKSLRANDAIGRFGGDEFVIILKDINSKNDVVALVNRIFNMFKDPILIENNSIKIDISFGASLLSQAGNREKLIYQADNAMYEAKKTSGSNLKFYSHNP